MMYVDGVVSHVVSNSVGQLMNLASDKHLVLGARQDAGGTGVEAFYPGKLYDVRIYSDALDSGAVLRTMTPPASGGYAGWATQHAGGGAANEDFNDDGVQNGIAYFMGAIAKATLPGIVNGQIAWPHDSTATGITWKVQASQDLRNWTDVTAGAVDAGGFVTYALPKTTAGLIVRLEVLAP